MPVTTSSRKGWINELPADSSPSYELTIRGKRSQRLDDGRCRTVGFKEVTF